MRAISLWLAPSSVTSDRESRTSGAKRREEDETPRLRPLTLGTGAEVGAGVHWHPANKYQVFSCDDALVHLTSQRKETRRVKTTTTTATCDLPPSHNQALKLALIVFYFSPPLLLKELFANWLDCILNNIYIYFKLKGHHGILCFQTATCMRKIFFYFPPLCCRVCVISHWWHINDAGPMKE